MTEQEKTEIIEELEARFCEKYNYQPSAYIAVAPGAIYE